MDEAEFRSLGHEIVDLLADYLATVADRPLFADVEPSFLDELFDEPLPEEGLDPRAVLRAVKEKLLPYATHVSHPGYFGLITPTPTPVGILGDFIASALNQNIGAYSIGPSGVAMERRVVRWLTDLAGYGERASGNLTSGGMMANFTGLKLARDWITGDSERRGVREPLAAYASEERHVSVDKAVDAVGMGREQLRILPTDGEFRIDLDALRRAIADDRRSGTRPVCIVGLAGTTNTGAVDDLVELRRIADEERLWLHVDAAYGGGMLLSRKRPGLRGIELADSIAIDPHKWFYAPLDVGAVLVKDGDQLFRSFGIEPPYLADNRAAGEERYQFFTHGFEQSRRLRSLKVWMSLKRYGAREVGTWVDRNVEQAERLYELVSASEDFRAAMRPAMSAVCVRYEPKGGAPDEDALGRLHKAVASKLEREGKFWLSTTILKGKWWFRICPVNFRTRLEHMDELFLSLTRECRALS